MYFTGKCTVFYLLLWNYYILSDLWPQRWFRPELEVNITFSTEIVWNGGITDGTDLLYCRLDKNPLDQDCEADMMVLNTVKITEEFSCSLPYDLSFLGNDEVPQTISNIYSTGFNAWDTRYMVPVFELPDGSTKTQDVQ